jgi:hypothetical protein
MAWKQSLFAPHEKVDTVYCSAQQIFYDEVPNLADKLLHEEHRKPTVYPESCLSTTPRSEAWQKAQVILPDPINILRGSDTWAERSRSRSPIMVAVFKNGLNNFGFNAKATESWTKLLKHKCFSSFDFLLSLFFF